MRLEQNLRDTELINEEGFFVSLQQEWLRYKSVLQVKEALRRRPVRKKNNAQFDRRVYRMLDYNREMEGGEEDNPEPESDGGGDDGGGGGGGGDEGAVVAGEPIGAPGEEALADDGTGGGGAFGKKALDALSTNGMLLRQFLAQALHLYQYITVPFTLAAGEEERLAAYQVLALNKKTVLTETYVTRTEEVALYKVTVQPVELWAPLVGAAIGRVQELHVFLVEEPSDIDIMEILGTGLAIRKRVHRWDSGDSDVSGCLRFQSRSVVSVNLPLESPSIPCLALMDVLSANGWVGVQHKCEHSRHSIKEFDGRKRIRNAHICKCCWR